MSILEKLRSELNQARKSKQADKIGFLSFLIAQIEIVGKNDGNRMTTEQESIRAIKKLISAIQDSPPIAESESGQWQVAFMSQYLPAEVSMAEVAKFVDETDFSDMKAGMLLIKLQFGESVDMKLASGLVRKKLGL